jgi:hypothetical protein
MNLHRYKTFEAAWLFNSDGSKKQISQEELDRMINSGEAKKVSLKDYFKGPIKSPFPGLVIKTNSGYWGVIIDVFKRNDDFLFDMFMEDGEIEKNLSWNRDFKVAYGDKIQSFMGTFGENGVPNKRHEEEIVPLIEEAEERLGISLGVAKEENLH